MDILQKATEGNIVFVPSNGSPRLVTEIPDGLIPHYSGKIIVLAGDQSQGSTNITLRTQTGMKINGDVCLINQQVWHSI